MTDKITHLPTITTLPIPPKGVLEVAIENDLEEVLVIGVCKGGILYTACSTAEIGEMLLLMERAKRSLMTHVDDSGSL